MNDRIYTLAKEAGLIEFEPLGWNPELQCPHPESVVKARKFAELVIQECVNVLYDNDLYSSDISRVLWERFHFEEQE